MTEVFTPSSGIRLDVDAPIATLVLDRPEHRNAWTIPMVRALSDALDWCDAADDVRVVVVTGAGDHFSVGADLGDGFEGDDDVDSVELLRGLTTPRDVRKPVIAAINGDAIGMGVTLSLLCDIRIVAEEARLAIPMTRLGVIPEMGSHWTLPRIVGLGPASELMLTGRRFSGAEAGRLGLCNYIEERGQVLPRAYAIAELIVRSTAPRAVAVSKRLMLNGLERRFESSLAREAECFVALSREPDAREGVNAFLEKRDPRWTGSLSEPLPGQELLCSRDRNGDLPPIG